MRKLALVSLAALALPAAPAIAQAAPEAHAPDTYEVETGESAAGRLAEKLRDPATQDRLAGMVAVMSEVLLDLPLAPMAEAVAEASGEDPADIDPDMTLRDMAPGADGLQDEIAEELPRMMDTMGTMAGAFETMLPALREMAERMEGAMEDRR